MITVYILSIACMYVRHADEFARCERIRCSICHPNFFLYRHDVHDRWDRACASYLIGITGYRNRPARAVDAHGILAAITPFLILHAFSSGTAALTGIEAISNGITAFKEPRSKNAGITLIWMASILGALFLGNFLSYEEDWRSPFGESKLLFRNWPARSLMGAASLSHGDLRHHRHPDPGCQHGLCRISRV